MITGKEIALTGAPKKNNSALSETICQVAIFSSGVNGRRQFEVIYTIMTFYDLTLTLRSEGFELSRPLVYLRLVLEKFRSAEGKRHVHTALFKL